MTRNVLILLSFFALTINQLCFADIVAEDASPNYLILLVHGITSNKDAFGGENGLKQYLENNLGLRGYIYTFAYDFSNNRGSIINQAGELGDATHANPSWAGEMPSLSNQSFWEANTNWSIIYKNHSWISQSKDYFRVWFKWQNPNNPSHRDPTASEVPRKVILICHSMGGLAGTYYITSDFYQNDVQRVITLDTPHIGFDLAVYMDKYYSLDNLGKTGFTDDADRLIKSFSENLKKAIQERLSECLIKNVGDSLGGRIGGLFSTPSIDNIYRDSTNWVIAAESRRIWDFYDFKLNNQNVSYDLTVAPFIFTSFLELLRAGYFAGEGLKQMHPDSDFIKNLENADIKSGSDNIDFRLVSARGAPTPDKDYINRYFLTTPYIAQQLIPWSPEYQALPYRSQKYWSLLASTLLPGVFAVKDGSIAVSVDSSRGEGIKLFEKYNTKRYDAQFKSKTFEDAMAIVNGEYDACLAAYILSCLFSPVPPPADIFFLVPKITLTFYSLTLIPEDLGIEKGANSALKAHMVIPSVVTQKEADGTSIIDKTLDNIALVGGNHSTGEAGLTGLSANSVTTSGYTAPQQAFVLLSDLDPRGQPTGIYHTVTIEAINYGTESRDQLFPLNINSQKKWVYSVTVKEPPTAMKAVVNTYMPKRLKKFNYSDNFADWKPISEVDEWGNFVVKGLKLAEGQNVLSYDIETWTGLKSNKQIRVVCNTIPLVASDFTPIPGIYTNNNRQTFKGKFGKAAYSSAQIEAISLRSAKLVWGSNEADVTSKVKFSISGGTYDKYLLYEFTPEEPLPDGYYTLVINVNSNIGSSQAAVDFTVDTQAPAITMEPIKPYSPRAPAVIRYSSLDELSPNLQSIRCDLYDSKNNLIANIATADSLSKGDNFFTFDPTRIDVSIPDGNYKVKIKAFDLAGNAATAEQPINIDSTPPTIAGLEVTPNPMTSKTTELGFAARVNEKSTVIIKLNNTSNNSTAPYLTQAIAAADGASYTASYAWKYDDALAKGPEDGIYRVEVVAIDEAGNESAPRTLEAVRIDRTPPKIYGQITNPYVLSNIGNNAYKTTLSYNLADAANVKVKIYNSNTGALVDTIPAAPSNNGSINNIAWNGSDQPKGAYKFQIIAEDDVGNVGTAYASCVKDGIAPVIAFPADDNAEVSGTIAVRGTAVDPDWTNDKPFKDYKVYYQKTGGDWQSDFVEVPQINREPNAPKNISIRPLQNNSTLAYLYTNNLENGEYTIKVEVEEENGEIVSSTRIVKVNNDPLSASSAQMPYVKLKPVPASVEFKSDDSVKLPLGFTNSVKPANVYVEVIKTGSVEAPVYFKYFPNILGAPFIGKPDYKAGSDLGYFIWSNEAGYHLRWSADGSNHKFTGSIILTGGGAFSDIKAIGSGIKVQAPLISWDSSISGGEGGIDFKINSGQLMMTTKIDEDPTNPSITANNVYLGVSKYSPQYLPVIIDVSGQRLVDITKMGQPAETSNLERATQTIEWNGKLETGSYVDNGTYIIRVRAEGADGIGMAADEARLEIKTPFELTNLTVDPADRKFSTLGGINRVSISYNVSKDSIITAIVQKQSGEFVSTLADGKEVLGAANPNNPLTISWGGNFPNAESTTVVTGGTYKLKLNIAAKDGSASENKEIDNISIASFDFNDKVAAFDPIGEEINFNDGIGINKIRLAAGDSPYYFEAKGFGRYYPPKDFNYTLTASGKQSITAYPYVPFAALMHRRFIEVDTKVKVTFNIHAWNCELGAEDYWLFGKWWNPWKWRTDLVEKVETVWLDKDDLPGGSGKGVIFKQGDEDKSYQFEFDTNNWWHQDGWAWQWGKPNPGSGINSIDVLIEVYAKDGSFVLDNTSEPVAPNLGNIPLIKGAFKINYAGSQYSTTHLTDLLLNGGQGPRSYGAYRANVNLGLDAPIAYSRLTNRFVPWFGFVRAGAPVSEKANFSGYLDDLGKLGFPGKSYFVGNTAAAASAPHKGNFNASLFPGNTNTLTAAVNGYSVPKVAEINSESNSKMTGSASDYTSYLSGETLEFITITSPYGGKFELNGNPISGTLTLSQQNSYPIHAKTDLTYAYNGNPPSPFEFSWPMIDSEIQAVKAQQTEKRKMLDKDLGGNPQNYTGPTLAGTWWDLDDNQIAERRLNQNNSKAGGGQTRFDKSVGKSLWKSGQSFGQFLLIPDFVNKAQYSLASNTAGIKVAPASGDKNSAYGAENLDTTGISWTTSDDNSLLPTTGLIKSPGLIFNEKEFYGRRDVNISDFYSIKDDYQSSPALKFAFLKSDPFDRTTNSPIDNPNLVITDWDVKLKDKTGGANKDIVLEKVETAAERDWQSHYKNDKLKLKLKLDASEARYVEIVGNAAGPYELMYFDGKAWKTFYTSNSGAAGHLGWWNVSRLNGKHTILLKSNNYIATQDISIGTLVKKDEKMSAYSTYKRAQLEFPKGAFVNGSKLPQDQLVTITPVTMNEIYIRNRPIIITSGPIVEIKPSPWKFRVSTEEGIDERPTLKFLYTFDDLKELGVWDGVGLPSNIPWNIHQVTAAGDLQIISGNKQEVENNNGEMQYAFYAPLDHFSTYALLSGKFKLSAPMVFADRDITNKNTSTIYGTAEPNSIVTLYVKTENLPPDVEKGELYAGRMTAEDKTGNFRFENIVLPQEGNNYFFVTSHQGDDKSVRTMSELTIVKDIVPPSAEVSQSLFAFSPNGDGKFDSVDYSLKTNENGRIFFQLSANGAALLNQDISAEANKEVKLTWGKESFKLFRRDKTTGQWILFSETPINERLADGDYYTTVYAIDEAGNISNNRISKTAVDTKPPTILGFLANPNPFTPNDDGVKDTTKFWYKFSEPAYVMTNINRDDGRLFRSHEGPTENFTYPTAGNRDVQSQVPSPGAWTWDGRGARNELLGGVYAYSIIAEDNVGNISTSEAGQVTVDCEPTLIPYAYTEPDPFAPVNSDNSFTEIKYYLARDNLKTSVKVIGQEGKILKTLAANEIQGKGEHALRWYGDFESNYDGPTAPANKYRVADGSYQFKVSAEDLNEQGARAAEASNTVLVDNIPPQVAIKSFSVDYLKKQAELTYAIPENCSVEVSVFDQQGGLLSTIMTKEAQAAGEHSLTYNLQLVPSKVEGQTTDNSKENYIKIVAVDRAKNRAENSTQAFATAPNHFGITAAAAQPAAFSPNGDGITDRTRLSYRISGGVPDYLVDINITTRTGALVKALVANDPQSAGTYSFYWDGLNDSKQPAADGFYEYHIIATDKQGGRDEKSGGLLLISTLPAVSLTVAPDIFSPNGDGASDTMTANYRFNFSNYLSGEGLVKLEVISSSGEAAWSKTFNQAAGAYKFEYEGTDKNGAPLSAGAYYLRASAQDPLGGAAVPQTVPLTVDYSQPEPADFSIIPAYARLGSDVKIKINFPEKLMENPGLQMALNNGALRVPLMLSPEGDSYEFHYLVAAEDAEGPVEVSLKARDRALNPIQKVKTFVIDKTSPEVSSLAVLPNPGSVPAVSGQVSLKFNVSEPLSGAPKVYMTQNGAPPQLLVTGGQWQAANGQCEAKYDVISGYDGPALITVEAIDLALNKKQFTFNNTFMVDTVKPVFSHIRSEISSNPEYTGFAKEGAVVTLTFDSSEQLKFNPEVKVNQSAAAFSRRLPLLTGESYEYQYTVSNTDLNGNANISISGLDFALNEGKAETASSAESFVIDLEKPTVAIAAPGAPGSYICNPGHFSTNARPDGSDLPRSTTFYYTLAEPSKIVVSVHKVNDNQAIYTKADFNDSNPIKVLVNNVWQSGSQSVVWDGAGADNQPGKYAFIVEGRDRAGNLTLKKWGGTVWLQNNVLTLKESDQRSEANNPEPKYFSPNGNSQDPAQKKSKLYFMIDLAQMPERYESPERIEAAEVIANTKVVGKYSVKVYGGAAFDRLIRIITEEADAQAETLTWEFWDGRDEAGQFAADGTYRLVVDVKDFAGLPAVNNLLKRTVVVDNTAPSVTNLSVSNAYFSGGKIENTDPARQTTTIAYHVGDNNTQVRTAIDIFRSGTFKRQLMSTTVQNANADYAKLWSGEGYDVDGTYTYRITTVDQAGNTASAEGTAVIDQTAPAAGISINNNDIYATLPGAALNLTYSDATSGVDKMCFSNDGSSWAAWEDAAATRSWNLPVGDGAKTVYVKYSDRAGNYSSNSDVIVLDTTPPNFLSVNISETPVNQPVGSWSTHDTPMIDLSVNDATSKLNRVEYSIVDNGYRDTKDCSGQSTFSGSWHQAVPDGGCTVILRAYDNAGLYTDSPPYVFRVDTTPPNAPSVSVDHTPVNSWSNHNTPYFSWGDPGDGNGSGVRYYRGFIDGVDQGNVSPGWHPTLSEGTHNVFVRAFDGVGLYKDSSSNTFKIDTTAPVISFGGQAWDTWYSADNAITISLSDNLSYRGFKWSWDAWPADDPSGCDSAASGSTTHSSQGPRTLYARAWDSAGNETTYSKTYYRDSIPPTGSLSIGTYTNSASVTLNIAASDAQSGASEMRISNDNSNWSSYSYSGSCPWVLPSLDGYRSVYIQFKDRAGNWSGSFSGGTFLYLEGPKTINTGNASSRNGWWGLTLDIDPWGNNQQEIDASTFTLPYDMSIQFISRANDAFSANGPYTATYEIRKKSDNTVVWTRTLKDVGNTSTWATATDNVDLHAGTYYVYIDLLYKLSAQGDANATATITGVPAGFVKAYSVKKEIVRAAALESPALIAPTNNNQGVSSIRPTFEWQHHRGTTTNYQIDVAKDSSFAVAHQAFTKASNAGSQAKPSTDPDLYDFNYSIHEFDPGLDKDTYYWKVTALSTNEAATSEVWSFQIAPELTLTGVTNYPNPFNPNKETTKVRYRLGADADEVKIRIYDITGSLVNELIGTTNGEGSSIWNKYNDVEWNARNGRGEMVMNGIYPFEVQARLGSQTLSARGKIAVLK